jgi:hypothetical protein
MMKIRTTAVMAALVLGAAAFADEAATDVQNDAFSIRLPARFAAFTAQAQTAKAEEGTIETTNWVSKAPTGEAVVVTVSKMPGKILDPDKLMTSTRETLLKSLNATLENEEKIAGDLPATNLTFRSASAAFLRSRLVVDGDRLVQVLYVGRSEEQRAANAVGQLFDSFKIASAAAPAPVQ